MAGKSKKPIPPEKQLPKLVQELLKEYESWQHYHDHGGSDPTWPDGTNMELICNHISWYKRQIKELCEESGLALPEEYNRPAPEKSRTMPAHPWPGMRLTRIISTFSQMGAGWMLRPRIKYASRPFAAMYPTSVPQSSAAIL